MYSGAIRACNRHIARYRQRGRGSELQRLLLVLSRRLHYSGAGLHPAHAAFGFQSAFWSVAADCLWSRCSPALACDGLRARQLAHFFACCSVRYRGNILCGVQPLAGAISSLSSVADGLTVHFLLCLLAQL
jgi:hypothetical protein